VDQRVPEIRVGAVGLVGQLAQLCVALALRQCDWVRGRLAGARRLCLLLVSGGFGLGLELVMGALDRGLDELAVQRSVDDDRAAALVMPRRLLCRSDERGRVGVP